MKKLRWSLSCVGALALFVTACGRSDDAEITTTPAAQTTAPAATTAPGAETTAPRAEAALVQDTNELCSPMTFSIQYRTEECPITVGQPRDFTWPSGPVEKMAELNGEPLHDGAFTRAWPEELGTMDCDPANLITVTAEPVSGADALG